MPGVPCAATKVAIGLVAAMLGALEIVWTRIFSAEFFYMDEARRLGIAYYELGESTN